MTAEATVMSVNQMGEKGVSGSGCFMRVYRLFVPLGLFICRTPTFHLIKGEDMSLVPGGTCFSFKLGI